jgi:hypothetical protein
MNEVYTYSMLDQNGDNEIRLSGLSSCIVDQSVRVTGLSPDVRLVDIVCDPKTFHRFRPSDNLQSLNAKKKNLEAQRRIHQEKNEVYASYAKSLVSEHVSPQELVPFMQTLVQERQCVLDAITSLDEQIHAVSETIAKQGARVLPTGRVTIHMFVDRTGLEESPPLGQSSHYSEPDEEWKTNLRNDIDAELAPDINMLISEKAKKLSIAGLTAADRERIERDTGLVPPLKIIVQRA